uniref:Uncharacterized protein n=1 Tax=Picea glauca TaxID=3330 RepID=A0A101LZJ3_PICGL|nr:hypothetical protein ABT39_MTgene5099 [Picea glauca]
MTSFFIYHPSESAETVEAIDLIYKHPNQIRSLYIQKVVNRIRMELMGPGRPPF